MLRESLITESSEPRTKFGELDILRESYTLMHPLKRELRSILEQGSRDFIASEGRAPTEGVTILTRDETIILD
jgi:hypothetical protein